MMKILAVLQARMSSSRLPGKILRDLCGAPMMVRQIERLRRSRYIEQLVVATSTDVSDNITCDVMRAAGVMFFRGSLDDVLSRFVTVIQNHPADHIVRLTADCPLADPDVIDAVIAHHIANAPDVTTNSREPTFPDGLDVEIVRAAALLEAGEEAQLPSEREHVTPFIYNRPERYRIAHYRGLVDYSSLRWTVDEPEDFELVEQIYRSLFPSNPAFSWRDVLVLLQRRPELSRINSSFKRNAGFAKSLAVGAKKKGS